MVAVSISGIIYGALLKRQAYSSSSEPWVNTKRLHVRFNDLGAVLFDWCAPLLATNNLNQEAEETNRTTMNECRDNM